MNKGKSTIEVQMEKLFKHTRSNSYGTRAKYATTCGIFVRFLNEKYKIQNLRNVQDKHVIAFIEHRQSRGLSPKTIKTDLGAIRYMHDLIADPRHQLSDNLQLRKIHGVKFEKVWMKNGNRAWTSEEFENFKGMAERIGQVDARNVAVLCRTMGLRIAEATLVSRAQAAAALRTGVYQVQGEAKNGKWREVPLSKEARQVFETKLKMTDRRNRLFVDPGEKSHEAINRYEKFLQHHRDQIRTEEGINKRSFERDGIFKVNEITYHGLRYAYVQNRIEEEVAKGYSEEQAAQIVTREVGHERIDVIEIYKG